MTAVEADQNAACSAAVIGNVLNYNNRAGGEGHVDLTDIVGVLPRPGHQSEHLVLFLDQTQGHEDDICPRLAKICISSLVKGLSPFLREIPSYLQQGEPVQVVISTQSGTGIAKTVFQRAVQPFLTYLAISHQVHETQSDQTILGLSQSQFLERACAGIPQTIILLSGDGGLIDIVDVFYRTHRKIYVPPHIALVPCGTGNAMASSIGLRSGPASSLTGLLQGQPVPVPIFAARLSAGSRLVVDEGRHRSQIDAESDAPHRTMYGAVVASWGLHAALVADSDTIEYRKFGSERFKMAANELLYPSDGTDPHRFQGKITLTTMDRQTGDLCEKAIEDHEHTYVLATLVPRLEKEFLISPDSEPLGGQMRLLRFGPLPAEETMRLMSMAYEEGKHVREETVTYDEVERLRIDFYEDEERWRRVCIDGKIVAVEKGGWIELHKESRQLLNVIKP
ncbi:ATP-NAD kinase PpnK-type [Penicillium maclennaniae]|uniref:ATP-NAD kinase PpnK-type n=1 Tax=Penicillium maclennaniae TaxID=1343394 RepID=UPI00253F88FD|nr:ATP-NAD kinase PpnK-type [Penicillium maclennaniae]KAJ5667920.1 ATP-NAD kinase PpnK-type [Penicillium maclennaniae]